MSHDVGAAHGHHDDHHGGHWEWSVYPFLASFGIFALAAHGVAVTEDLPVIQVYEFVECPRLTGH